MYAIYKDGLLIRTPKMNKPHHPDVVYNHNKLNRKLIDILICVRYYYGGRNYGLLLLERLCYESKLRYSVNLEYSVIVPVA